MTDLKYYYILIINFIMSSLKEGEKRVLEMLFEMDNGYVIKLSNNRFQDLVRGATSLDIYNKKYAIYGDSKAKRLRAFWTIEDDITNGKVLLELLEVWRVEKIGIPGITSAEKVLEGKTESIINRLFKTKNKAFTEDSFEIFLNKEFENVSLNRLNIDGVLIDILDSRILEIKNSIKSKSALACIILCGSVLEGLLLGVASSKMKEFNQCIISPKDKETGKALIFSKWTLSNFIDVAHNLEILGLDVKEYSHSLRGFRNYIHPYEQMLSNFNPDIETAKISWQVLKAAITDLSKNNR